MGIEKFFSTINRNFKVTSTINFDNINSKSDLIRSKYLFIDFNSIIHNVSSKLIGELNQVRAPSKYSNAKLEDLEYLIIQEVNLFIIKLLEKLDLDSLELVYAALDGVPTFSKILEQKKRRFIGDFIEKLLAKYSLPFNWSKNNISPGTLFMEKINKYLNNIKLITKNKLVKKEDLILQPKDYEFYNNKIKHFDFSDTNSEGEGEMKIYDLINSLKLKKEESVYFYSPDADVILLSMISKNSNHIIILKYDQNLDEMFSINIQLLKQSIYFYCLERSEISELNIEKLIRDIVFIFTIFGNDFLPKCESIQTNLDFLFLIDMYLINLIDNNHLISNDNIINKSFLGYLELMAVHEKRMLFRNSYLNLYQNYNYANQTNFMIDLTKLKSTKNKSLNNFSSKKFGEPFYNLTNNILFYIDPFKIKDIIYKNKNSQKKYHGCLEFYLLDKYTLIKVVQESLQSILPINTLININLKQFNFLEYEPLRFTKFDSKQNKHIINMKDLSPRDKEMYLINNKLDKYHSLFNPINEFYSNILKTRKIDESYYYKKYFDIHNTININYKDNRKQVVNDYLKGFKWVFQYYFKRNVNIDETWFYPYFKAPLFSTLVKFYYPSIIDYNLKPKKLEIKPLEQLLYITPIRLSELSMFTEFKDKDFIKKVKLFIEKYPHFFYNLDEIYFSVNTGNLNKNLFDCSNSSFISKCHYTILNYIVDINQFIQKFRNID
jgi:5'-3' exonuclease